MTTLSHTELTKTLPMLRKNVDDAERARTRASRRHKDHGSQDTYDILRAADTALKEAERELADYIRSQQ